MALQEIYFAFQKKESPMPNATNGLSSNSK
jgi:hypothetical protein